MANISQCYYCFETLLASYEDRAPPALSIIESLWEKHEHSKKLAHVGDQLDDDEEEDDDEDAEEASIHKAVTNAEGKSAPRVTPSDSSRSLRPSVISRLQSETSSDSSSLATTPSRASNMSSRSGASSSTAATTPSARSERVSARATSTGQRYPLFVTWNTMSRGHKSLRGCIGTFEAQDLEAGLKSYALTSYVILISPFMLSYFQSLVLIPIDTPSIPHLFKRRDLTDVVSPQMCHSSAFDDSRFSPIPRSLLPSLSCSLTLLGSFEPCTNALDWSLGTHGIRISFVHRGRRYGATYLPDVAVEQGWTKEETIESLMRKAGWDGGSSGVARRLLRTGTSSGSTKPWEQVSDFRTVRYQGHKVSASYEDWQEWRKWVLSLDDGPEILGSA
ncbi:Uncharacterized protein PECH_008825 [Penicillium ucsense]|uniref:AMMECR1 domain-containing protein n=1 Tax=Penicillium ucsense TaxID=2839758 RepID=A0A8J8WAH5_9EURO|nr:Uncharacterized protein PECM_001520 [Penicillium ucsense]KAF7733888.1 Uncharacterized protein PECH_008825 [Penicillium ucsense]